jgi:hypothetical protein
MLTAAVAIEGQTMDSLLASDNTSIRSIYIIYVRTSYLELIEKYWLSTFGLV